MTRKVIMEILRLNVTHEFLHGEKSFLLSSVHSCTDRTIAQSLSGFSSLSLYAPGFPVGSVLSGLEFYRIQRSFPYRVTPVRRTEYTDWSNLYYLVLGSDLLRL